MAADFISVNPKEAHVRDLVVVCYDFAKAGQTGPVEIRVTFYGFSQQTITLTPANSGTEIQIPTGCTGVLLEDLTGGSDDATITVTP